jgi:ATP-dependent Zn protease
LRPGRFDKTIRVDVPSRAGRREIIDYYLKRKSHEEELNDPEKRDALAGSTFGYSPVMLEHLFDEALVWAIRGGRSRMSWTDVQQARMTEELGLTQSVVYTEAERRAIATHEAGHATVAYFAAPERRLDVLSIIKRSDALGLLSHSETEERFTRTRGECEALLRISMGGMVAEEIFFGEASTGPSGDLTSATRLAAQMVGAYGMAGSLISLDASRSSFDIVTKVLSDETCRHLLDGMLESARDSARLILEDKTHVVEALRDALLERDELLGLEITDVIEAAAVWPGTDQGPLDEVIDVRPSALADSPWQEKQVTDGPSRFGLGRFSAGPTSSGPTPNPPGPAI